MYVQAEARKSFANQEIDTVSDIKRKRVYVCVCGGGVGGWGGAVLSETTPAEGGLWERVVQFSRSTLSSPKRFYIKMRNGVSDFNVALILSGQGHNQTVPMKHSFDVANDQWGCVMQPTPCK